MHVYEIGDDDESYLNHVFVFSSRIVGAIIIPLICMERVVLGYHTVAQVTVGSCLGILLHVYSTRLPQALVFVDAFLHIVAGAVLLLVDPALVYEPNSTSTYLRSYLRFFLICSSSILLFT